MEAHGAAPTEDVLKKAAGRWLAYWLDQLAVVHARFTARTVYNRASACKDALNAPLRHHDLVDVDTLLPLKVPLFYFPSYTYTT